MSRRGPRAALCLLAASLVLAACTAPQTRRLLDNPPGAERAAELGDVPFHASSDTLCGPTSLAMLLGHRGLEADVETLTEEVYLPGREGSLQIEMQAALRARGLLTYRLAPKLDDLLAEIRAGNPVLVLQNLGLSWLPRWHYAVVVGYDLDAGVVILRSGELERRETALTAFENTWARSGYWALVASEPDRPPATAHWLDWLRAATDLKSVDHDAAAREAFRAAAVHWPDEPKVLMAVANEELDGGDSLSAEYLLRMAVRVAPDDADAWNNLAHTLVQRGCGQRAQRAAECALRISPGTDLYLQTLHEALDTPELARCESLVCPVY